MECVRHDAPPEIAAATRQVAPEKSPGEEPRSESGNESQKRNAYVPPPQILPRCAGLKRPDEKSGSESIFRSSLHCRVRVRQRQTVSGCFLAKSRQKQVYAL